MNVFSAAGAAGCWLLVSFFYGELLPLFSVASIISIVVGTVIGTIAGAVLSGHDRSG